MKALGVALSALVLVSGCAAHATTSSSEPLAPSGSGTSGSTHASNSPSSPAPPFDKTRHSLTDPNSIWVIVNKTHPITPLDFRPRIALVRGYQVAVPAAGPLTRLMDDADRAGVPLKIASAFRSYGYQEGVHSHLVATEGLQAADAISARPGYSEHQTGLAVDLQPADGTCALSACFSGTAAGRWLVTHAWRYGFVVRYTQANRRLTGYSPEPWHFRYVGVPLARELRTTHAGSLEAFFGVGGGDYR
ncbi:MAG: M15 family metallopeptidase [Nocardioides sp.]